MGFSLNAIDITIILSTLLITVGVGLYASRNQGKSAKSYFLASGQLPWYIIGSAFVSTSVSSEQIVGTIGAAYRHGMGIANNEWFTVPHYTLLMLVFVPMYLRNRITTVPDFLSRRFGPLCGDIYSWVMLVAYIVVFMVPVMYGGSFAISNLTGWDFYWVLWIMVVLIGAYAIKGGLASVMWTDAVQCIMLVGGGMVLFFTALHHTPGGWHAMIQADPDRFHLYRPVNDEMAPFLGMILFVFSGGLFYQAGNQVMIQRILGARSRWDGMMGVVFAGFVNMVRPLVTCFLGFVVYYWITHLNKNGGVPLKNQDSAFSFVLQQKELVGSWGLRGIVLAGFLAAVMSTISALSNSTATIFSLEVYHKLINKTASEKQLVAVGRIAAIIALALAALLAPSVPHFGHIFGYFQTSVTYLATPFSSVILLGVFWKRTNYQGALFGLIGGAVIMASVVVGLNLAGVYLHWFYNASIAQVIIIVGAMVVSLATPPPSEDQWKPFLWSRKWLGEITDGQSRPWYYNWVFWFVLYVMVWTYCYWLYW